SWRSLEGRGRAYKNHAGQLVAVVVARDVTERKAVEAQLRERADLLDQARDAISVLDLENRILYWNSGAERLYGLSKADVVGHQADVILRPSLPGRHEQIRREVLEKGEWRGDMQHTKATGEFILLDS